MRKIFPVLLTCIAICSNSFSQGKVGINTTSPQAMLHVKDSNVLFTGLFIPPLIPGNPPASGQGVRMMWYPDKAAFRAGFVTGTEWDKDNIGYYSTALGTNTIASGTTSIAAGYATRSSGYISAAFGNGTTASGDYSTSVGNLTIAKPFASVALGQFNDTTTVSSGSWDLSDPVFIIGNGSAFNARNNAITVLKNGKTGINTSTPQAMLHVKDSSVLFTGNFSLPITPGNTPVSGQGVRMLWYPDKAAFRAGSVFNSQWDKEFIGNYSFASGNTTMASGIASTAMGQNSVAAGNYSMAMGFTGTAAMGNFSIAMGHGAIAYGSASIALGDNTIAGGITSIAMGTSTNASGDYSTSMGSNTIASGDYSIALGGYTIASGTTSTAFGASTIARGTLSTTMGRNTIAKPFASFVLGQFNDTTVVSSIDWNSLDPVFVIGNGTDLASSNAFTVLKNAKTGINIEYPLAGLHIKGVESSFDAHIRLETAGGGTDYANILYDGNMKFKTFTAGDEYQWRNSANNTTMTLEDAGNLYIDGNLGVGTTSPGAKMKVNGSTVLGTNGTALTEIIKMTITKDIASVALNSSNPETFLVANCALASTVYVSPASPLTNGLIIAFARVSVAGTVEVTFTNTTGAAINMPSMDYYITVIR